MFDGQLRVNLQSWTKDWIGKDAKLWGWQLSLIGVKLHGIKSWDAIIGAIKNWTNRDCIEIFEIPN